MRRRMARVQDLIEEFKVRTVYWAICIFAISYFLSHTSKSMWTNIPLSILILSAFRYLSYEVELRWKVQPNQRQTYLSHLEKKQISINDSRLSTAPTTRWRKKIDSPLVEAAINDLINKILHDFVLDLWYSSITPDKEAPELIRTIIFDALGEVSGRVKEINLVDLLTRDIIDLVGNHLDLYRKNQSEIGADVMGGLSSEERDVRLKRHLMAAKELHPALMSPECEYKVLQRLMGGLLAIVLKPREAQCPLVRCFSREFFTCLVMQPVMNFASPGYVNEIIEYILLNIKDTKPEGSTNNSSNATGSVKDSSVNIGNPHPEPESDMTITSHQSGNTTLAEKDVNATLKTSEDIHPYTSHEDSAHHAQPRPAEWAMMLDAATKRRSQVLAPENLENMWTKGRNYKKKSANLVKADMPSLPVKAISEISNISSYAGITAKEMLEVNERTAVIEDKYVVHLMHGSSQSSESSIATDKASHVSEYLVREQPTQGGHLGDGCEETDMKSAKSKNSQLKRSSSSPDIDTLIMGNSGEPLYIKDFYSPKFSSLKTDARATPTHGEGLSHVPKIKCRVVGAYFENTGSKSFAVYAIAVTDAENKTWFVKRRYRNFERLHRHLKDIPNYSLHLPPKRFLSSSIDDYFVHQRCILLDKYLQDLLSIGNVAEQHEVWDFFSASSKNYSHGKSTSVMKTLAVNVDDAMDDIVRQFKGVSDGLRRRVVGSPISNITSSPIAEKTLTLSWNEEDIKGRSPSNSNVGTSHSLSDDEVPNEGLPSAITGWHSDNELKSKSFPPRIVKQGEKSVNLGLQRGHQSDKFDSVALNKFLSTKSSEVSDLFDDLDGIPPEWTPPNVSVPLLNLVDKVFLLNRRGWLRRQVFWMSKQILQLMMEDAIDDWILRQINLLRSEEIIAQGIRWVQNVLWPNGTFFIKLESGQAKSGDVHLGQKGIPTSSKRSGVGATGSSSFEAQLEAARRASDVKKMILGGAPTTLVSLIGHKQYRRSAKDVYFFLQSSICLKQLAYSMLELVLLSLFPELRDLVTDIHNKAQYQQPL
ncbi:sorting nexin-13 protein [Dioscorea alata]|uniref:Sorting nexin-13 protein n=2 Tax=Dioscorea alata TaxID=55571 RepID=A0ACB7VCK4_DIOAL|nr:sorting nexin-13 protein [Dioscorea alata]